MKEKIFKFLGAHWWLGIGGIATIVMLVITAVSCVRKTPPSLGDESDPAQSSLGDESDPAQLEINEILSEDNGLTFFEISTSSESIFLPDINNITKLNIDNKFLDKQYAEAYSRVKEIYEDAKLRRFSIFVYPFVIIDVRKISIYFNFYSEWANKECVFVFRDDIQKIEHIPPDKVIRFDYLKKELIELPWKKSPNWQKFLDKVYQRMIPLTPNQLSYYHLYSNYDDTWGVDFNDGLTGLEKKFKWDGQNLDEQGIVEVY